jgi:hypothetical protein
LNAHAGPAWPADIAMSVAMYNEWFRRVAPEEFRRERLVAATSVMAAMRATADFTKIDGSVLIGALGILPTLRMATAPPIARDRLTGLSGALKSFVLSLDRGELAPRMSTREQVRQGELLSAVLRDMLDVDLMPWLATGAAPTPGERDAAALVLGDRLATSIADPIVRNAQEQRQLLVIEGLLTSRGYTRGTHPASRALQDMPAGTYQFRMRVMGGTARDVAIPVDCVIQPRAPRADRVPILVETKSAGDFTNVNKRRKEEADKHRNLQAAFGSAVPYVLFLCGYFDDRYLMYEVAAGMDFVWEHRPADLLRLGL